MGLLSKNNYLKKILFFISLGCFSPAVFASFNFSNQSATMHVTPGGRLVMVPVLSSWTGTLHQEGEVSGSTIGFDGGVLRVQDTAAFFKGTYNSSGSQQITLDGDKTLNVGSGNLSKRVLVGSTGNKILGQLTFADDTVSLPNIELQDGATALSLGVQGKLTSFVKLAGGAVTLVDDLNFGDGKRFDGVGVVNLNNKRVSFGGKDIHMTETVLWNDASDIILNSRVTLSGIWTFDGIGVEKEAHIIGNGNILDLGTTGSIRVRSGTKLYLTDIKLKGLGDGGYGSIVFDDSTSQIRLSHADIELANNYSVTSGGFYVEGSSRIITRDKNLIFTLNGTLTVDGITLEYDTASFGDSNNIVPANRGASTANIALLNSGAISCINGLSRQNSNALIYGLRANSNAIVKNTEDIKNNSNAIVSGGVSVALSVQNSNAIVVLAESGPGGLPDWVKQTSDAVVSVRQNVVTCPYINNAFDTRSISDLFLDDEYRADSDIYLHDLGLRNNALRCSCLKGDVSANVLGDLLITGPVYNATGDLYVCPEHGVIYFVGNTVFDGQGHSITCGESVLSSIFLDNNVTVTFTNVVFKNVRAQVFDLGLNASIVLGQGTVVEVRREAGCAA
ncbi:MAG: hypothetical protein ABH827_00700 [bacterium]